MLIKMIVVKQAKAQNVWLLLKPLGEAAVALPDKSDIFLEKQSPN